MIKQRQPKRRGSDRLRYTVIFDGKAYACHEVRNQIDLININIMNKDLKAGEFV